MPVDELWYHADRASQRAEQAYHRLVDAHQDFHEHESHRSVSRPRFRELTERVEQTGAPFGAHALVWNQAAEVLLVRHDGVDLWVLPGGEVHPEESFRDAAERELAEEAGITAEFDGLAMLTRVSFSWKNHEAWGVLPVFAAEAADADPTVADPDDEISRAAWFQDLPSDTRDRALIESWRETEIDRP
jgi:8-oxo-dGTP diphosphatase